MSGRFDAHLPWIKSELAANPAAALAISLSDLSHTADSHDLGLDLILDFAAAADPAAPDSPFFEDISLLRGAQDILDHRAPILGMSYLNFVVNVRDCGWSLSDFVPGRLARDVIARIVSAEPRLARIISERPALVPF